VLFKDKNHYLLLIWDTYRGKVIFIDSFQALRLNKTGKNKKINKECFKSRSILAAKYSENKLIKHYWSETGPFQSTGSIIWLSRCRGKTCKHADKQ